MEVELGWKWSSVEDRFGGVDGGYVDLVVELVVGVWRGGGFYGVGDWEVGVVGEGLEWG